jgi:GNAT superfamily N-acetyltransferase
VTAGVVVRPLVEADWPAVHDIVVEVARAGETYAMEVPADVEETRAFWTGAHRVVAEVDGVVLATAKMGPNRPAQGSHVGTASFMVSAAARGRGLGRMLGEHVVEWHRREGFRAIQFNAVVESNTAAVHLWQRLGFVVIGTVPGAFRRPDGSYVGLHVMLRDLVNDAVR